MSHIPEHYFSTQSLGNFTQVLLCARQESAQQVCLHLLSSYGQDLSLTYEDLLQRSLRYTRALVKQGIQSDEVVIIILPHGEDLVASFFGTILHGAIPSIMPYLTEKLQADKYLSSLQALFAITRPAGVITYADFEEQVRIASARGPVREVFVAEEIHSSQFQEKPAVALSSRELKGLDRPPASIVLLQHSSGTTGLQKGVALSHQAVFNQLESYSQALRLDTRDVIVSWLPLYHDMGLIAGFILPLLLRIPLVLLSPFDWVRAPQRLFHAIHRFRGTLCWLPNFAFNFCAQKIRDRDLELLDLTSLRAVINCSEPMHWKSHEQFYEKFQPYGFRETALSTSYAMAENVFAVTQGGIDYKITVDTIDQQAMIGTQKALPVMEQSSETKSEAVPVVKMLSAGRPIAGTQIRILSSGGQELPDRQIGEIALQSNCLLTGYYHRSDLTEKVFINGWYLTGDLGYLANGELFVTGRKKDLIIVGGKNIYPQDIETLAGEVDGIHPGRIVAIGVFNEDIGTEDIVLIAEIDDDTDSFSTEETELIRHERIAREIRQRVTQSSEVALSQVYLVKRNWLIKTSSGKIARSANRAKYLDEIS